MRVLHCSRCKQFYDAGMKPDPDGNGYLCINCRRALGIVEKHSTVGDQNKRKQRRSTTPLSLRNRPPYRSQALGMQMHADQTAGKPKPIGGRPEIKDDIYPAFNPSFTRISPPM